MWIKRLTTLAGFALCGLLSAGSAQAQTFNGSIINTAGNSLIPSTGTGGCTVVPQTTGGTIFNDVVAGLAAGSTVGTVQLNLTHTFDGDLDMFLVAPNGQIFELTSDNGGTGDNYTNTVFQDGATSITLGSAPFTGTFAGEGTTAASCAPLAGTIATLATFTATQNGTWQLVIMDDAGADTGTMLSWSITFVGPACTITCPANITVNNDIAQCGAVVTYPAPTVVGTCGTVSQQQGLPSGAFFPVGTTTNTYGNVAGQSCSFNVVVNDVEPPAITCPADLSSTLPPGSTTQPVTFAAPTVTDNCPGVQPPSCVPPSGSSFPAGGSSVLCDVLDGASNTASCSFLVTLNLASVVEVPTVSALGLAALALLLVGAAFLVLRRNG